MGRLRRLVELSGSDRRLLIVASIRLVIVTLGLRWLGFRWIATRLHAARPWRDRADDFVRAGRYATWVETAARCLPIQARCLAQSLALHWWLRSEGVGSELRIGVAKRDRNLNAHAWVELGGAPVNATMAELEPFTPLERVESGRTEVGYRADTPMATRRGCAPAVRHCMGSM